MRDARILPWVLADAARAGQLNAAQWQALLRLAAAEELMPDLAAQLAGTDMPADVAQALAGLGRETMAAAAGAMDQEAICRAAQSLFGPEVPQGGLARLWQLDRAIRAGSAAQDFWDVLLATSRRLSVTPHVSRALRLCHHLFETPVDLYLAWQAQRTDVFFAALFLARNGNGAPTAPWLRLAFKWRARWHAAKFRRGG